MYFVTPTHPPLNVPRQRHSPHESYAKTLTGLMPAEHVRCGGFGSSRWRSLPVWVLQSHFSGRWAQLVVPVIDRRVERYAIEHCGSLRTLLKLPLWKNLPSNVVRHVASFIQYTGVASVAHTFGDFGYSGIYTTL